MGILRTPESEKKYHTLIADGLLSDGCVLCKKESIKEFAHWRIIENDFPYDRIAVLHHMVIPKRHIRESELSIAEKEEFNVIKNDYINKEYEYIVEVVEKRKSIPEHFHPHLIIAKD